MPKQINLEEILKQELIPIVFSHSPEATFKATLRAMHKACEQAIILASENTDNTIEKSEEEIYVGLAKEINNSILDTIRQIV